MKNRFLTVILSFLIVSTGLSWGDEGHKLIGKQSVKHLNIDANLMKEYSDYLFLHSPDPDNRKKDDKTEGAKHFIDIDFYKEFLAGKMIFDRTELAKVYADSVIVKMGILPWATIDTYNKLVEAIKAGNKEKILFYMADLSHYVADGHQPMHSLLNYNGQLTGQKGIHGRYEIEMFDKNLTEVENSFVKQEVVPVKNLEEFIFSYINYSNFVSSIMFEADKIAFEVTGSRESDDYYRIMWFRTGEITKQLVNQASYHLALLYNRAWVEAGKPINGIK